MSASIATSREARTPRSASGESSSDCISVTRKYDESRLEEVDEMTSGTNTMVSRRSARLFLEEQEGAEAGKAPAVVHESQSDDRDKEKPSRETRTRHSSVSSNDRYVAAIDFGGDLHYIFPSTVDDIGKHGVSHVLTNTPYIMMNAFSNT